MKKISTLLICLLLGFSAWSQNLPLVDFTGFTGSNLSTVSPGWSEGEGITSPSGTSSGWTSGNFANDAALGRGTRINLFNANDDDWIVSPAFTVNSTASIEYDIALTEYLNTNATTLGSDDVVHLMVSTNGGINFSSLRPYSDSSVISNTGQHEFISLDQFAGQSIILGFYASEGTVDDPEDNDVHLDNILVLNPVATDLEMVEITSPAGSACYSAAETVVVLVKNSGLQPLDFDTYNTPVILNIAGPNPSSASTMISSGTLMPNATLSVTITTSADLSVAGAYDLQAYASYPGDLSTSNDTATSSLIAVPTLTGPTSEDFETFVDDGNFSGDGTGLMNGWTNNPNGPTSSFNWSVTTDGSTGSSSTGPDEDHTTGTGTYMYSESSNGSTGALTTLVSPCIDISGLTAPGFSFWYHMYGATIGSLEVYVVDAAGTESMVFTAAGSQQSAGSDPWLESITNLTGMNGPIQLKFVATKGSSSTGDIAIDDVRIFELPTTNMEMAEIVNPTGATCFSANENVSVKITNRGLVTLDFATDNVNIVVDVNGTPSYTTVVNTGSLLADSSLVVSVTNGADFSTPGTYALKAYLSVTDDGSSLNDTISSSINSLPILVAPLLEDLETFVDDGNFSGNGTGLMNGWTNIPTGPTTSFNWSVRSGTTGSSSTGPDEDHTTGIGSYMYSESSNGLTGDQAVFVSPCLDLSAVSNPGLSFWYHMYGATIASLEVYVIDGTGVDSLIFSVSGEQQASGSAPWLESVSNLTGFSGSIQLKFVATKGSDTTGDIAIDDIRIFELPPVNMEMTRISSPSPVICANNNETVRVEITNKGLFSMDFSMDSVAIVVEVDGVPTYTTNLNTGTLGVDTTMTVVVTTGADFSVAGTKTLRAYLSTTEDGNLENDTLSTTIQSIASVSSFPYSENFEEGAGSWTSGGTTNSWELGVPANTVINSAASGNTAWVTSLAGSYSSNENSEVLSPCLDLTNAPAGTVVALSIWYESESTYDGAVLQSSLNLGESWENIGAMGDPGNWYNDDDIAGEPGGQRVGWTGDDGDGTGGWIRVSHELDSSLIGQTQVLFRIAFGSDGSVTSEGFAFDSFVLATVPTVSLGEDAIFCPGSVLDAGNPGSIYLWSNGDTTQSIVLDNSTGAAILDSSIAVTVTDSLGFVVTDTIVVSITAGAPVVSIDPITSSVCFGDSTGSAVAIATGGSGMVSYSWNTDPVQTTDSISSLIAGMYIVTATDTAGCSSTDTLIISSTPEIIVAVDTIVGVACNVDTTGSISISATGGTGPLSFLWSNGDTTEDISGLMPGDYTAVITDSLGCSVSANYTVPATPGNPVAAFTYEMSGSIVGFTNTSTGLNEVSSYAWDFGDGATDTIASPAHYYNSNDTFTVSLTVTNQCGSSTHTDSINITTVGIEDDLLNQVKVFPNPSRGEFEVQFEGLNLDELTLSVISIDGKKVYSNQIGRVSGNFSERISLPATLARGVYVIQIQSKEAVVYKRIRLE